MQNKIVLIKFIILITLKIETHVQFVWSWFPSKQRDFQFRSGSVPSHK